MGKTQRERQREYRERKKAGQLGLVARVKLLEQRVTALEAVLTPSDPDRVLTTEAKMSLARLREHVRGIERGEALLRTPRPIDPPTSDPFGEWSSA